MESKLYSHKEIALGQGAYFHEIDPDDDNYYKTIDSLRAGYFKGQYGFHMPEVGLIGDLYILPVNSESVPLTAEQEHLLRPVNLKQIF